MLQILTTLIRAPPVAGLVLGRDQRVRAAAFFGHAVEVAARIPDGVRIPTKPDTISNMKPDTFSDLKPDSVPI